MENPNQTQSSNQTAPSPTNARQIIYFFGYFLLGAFYLIINGLPIPLGGVVGAIRLYNMTKQNPSFDWKVRAAILLLAVTIASGFLPIAFRIPFALNFGAH